MLHDSKALRLFLPVFLFFSSAGAALGAQETIAQEPVAEPLAAEPANGGEISPDTVFSTTQEVLSYLEQELGKCSRDIRFRYSGDVTPELIALCKDKIAGRAGAEFSGHGMAEDKLVLTVNYTDCAEMVGAYRKLLPESRLEGKRLKVYRLAAKIVDEARTESSNEYELALALHDYLVENCRYGSFSSRENAVADMLLRKQGICESYARTYHLLCSMAGIECRYIVGTHGSALHAWNLVRLNGEWAHVDCTADDPLGRRGGGATWRLYFGIPDAIIAVDHKWNRGEYPACKSDKLWYPTNHAPVYDTLDDMASALDDMAGELDGTADLCAYVREVEKQPGKLRTLLKKVIKTHRRGYSMEYMGKGKLRAFIILSQKGRN